MSSFCGLRSTHRGTLRKRPTPYYHPNETLDEWGLVRNAAAVARNNSIDSTNPWAREDQLSNIIEVESQRHTPTFEKTEAEALSRGNPISPIKEESTPGPTAECLKRPEIRRKQSFSKGPAERVKIVQQELRVLRAERKQTRFFLERRNMDRSPITPQFRPIQPPSNDLETIARIDASLKFEHFTTEDAWVLGSALRERLLGIPTPVVINIALANQNQTLFHTATHSGVTPDNDCWIARKRKTVLRFGVSTFYMHNKFEGDELAFKEKYGLGSTAGEYAIHGGGVPIRVTGVEGIVAVVVVSGLKQDEDHAVIVEVIRDLYY